MNEETLPVLRNAILTFIVFFCIFWTLEIWSFYNLFWLFTALVLEFDILHVFIH